MQQSREVRRAPWPLTALVTRDHYYIYVNPMTVGQDQLCGVEDLEFGVVEMPISLARYESLARSGMDPREWPQHIDSSQSPFKSYIFVTISHGALVNVTGMTATRAESVYSDIRKFWPRFTDNNATLYAGYSETSVVFRRRGVYTWVHGMIFAWARRNGFERVILLEGEDQPGPRSSQDKLGSAVVAETCHVTLFSGLRSKYRASFWVTNPRLVHLLTTRRRTLSNGT